MELRHLRYFIAVAEERSFTRAADRLALAQPPLSQQIRRLEADLGFPLFERTSRGVRMTRGGEALLPGARAVLQAAEEARMSAQAAHDGVAGRLAIAYMNSAAYGILPRVLKSLRAAHPDIRIEVRELAIADQLDALVEGRVDVGILRPPIDDARLDSVLLLEEAFVVALPTGHPLVCSEAIHLHELEGESLIGYPRGHPAGFRERIDTALRNEGVTPKVVHEATHVHSLCGLVAAGLGASIVPASARALGIDGAHLVPLVSDLKAEVRLAWLRAPMQPQVQHLVTLAQRGLPTSSLECRYREHIADGTGEPNPSGT